jgi:ribosomal 30S subunit maturation factor RimM
VPGEAVVVGVVRSVNPARRELRVSLKKGEAGQLANREWIRVVLTDGTPKRCRVAGTAGTKDEARMTLTPGITRDTVAKMRGASVVLDADERYAMPDEGLTLESLVGLTVEDEAGTQLGEVAEAYAMPASGVMEVDKPGGGRMLLPVIDQVIVAVDMERQVLVVADITPYAVDDAN